MTKSGAMLSKVGFGVRVGAAAFVAGMSLVGPQVVGVAAADNAETDATSVSAGPASPAAGKGGTAAPRRSPVRGAGRVSTGRPAASTADVAGPSGITAAAVDAAEVVVAEDGRPGWRASSPRGGADRSANLNSAAPATQQVQRAAGTPTADSAPSRLPGPGAAVPATAADDRTPGAAGALDGGQPDSGAGMNLSEVAGVVTSVGAADQVVAAAVAPTASPGAPVRGQVFAPLIIGIERAFDVVGGWLSSFSPNPITDFLAGAVWLVRRTLFPTGAGVGPQGLAPCVQTKDCSGQDLTGVDLVGQDLSYVDFFGATLRLADLSKADMTGAYLGTANLTSAKLAGANLTDADFMHASLVDADLTRAKLTRTRLAYSNLTGALLGVSDADLLSADLRNANLTKQILSGRNLPGIDLSGANLTDVKLRRANLTGANLSRANFFRAQVQGATLNDANLSGANLNAAGFNDYYVSTSMERANLTDANLTNAFFMDAYLISANLTNANLTYANLRGAILTGATVTGVIWYDTTCPNGRKSSTGCA